MPPLSCSVSIPVAWSISARCPVRSGGWPSRPGPAPSAAWRPDSSSNSVAVSAKTSASSKKPGEGLSPQLVRHHDRPVGPRGAVIGWSWHGQGRHGQRSGADCLSCRSMRQWCHLARLDLSGPCAPSPLAVYALRAARPVTDAAIRRTQSNAVGREPPPEGVRSVLCIYCRTDKFVCWPPAWRLPSADCPGCQRRIAEPAATLLAGTAGTTRSLSRQVRAGEPAASPGMSHREAAG